MYQSAAAQETWTAKLPGFFQKFWKTMRALRANETKVALKNAFIVNLFSLESEKESKNDEKILF